MELIIVKEGGVFGRRISVSEKEEREWDLRSSIVQVILVGVITNRRESTETIKRYKLLKNFYR